jgi:hypothetical protein
METLAKITPGSMQSLVVSSSRCLQKITRSASLLNLAATETLLRLQGFIGKFESETIYIAKVFNTKASSREKDRGT